MPRILRLISILFLALTVGCGDHQPRDVLGGVSGRVTFENEAVSDAMVIFQNPAKGLYKRANVGEDGTYRVKTVDGYGLPLGDYEVYVSPRLPDIPMGPVTKPLPTLDVSKMPERYRDPATSGLRLTVKDGKHVFNIDMKP